MHITFPPDATKKIRADLERAGDGAMLLILMRGTEDGKGIKYLIDVRGGSLAEGTCDPTNDSHVCPPICP